jgi:hypothetical protein
MMLLVLPSIFSLSSIVVIVEWVYVLALVCFQKEGGKKKAAIQTKIRGIGERYLNQEFGIGCSRTWSHSSSSIGRPGSFFLLVVVGIVVVAAAPCRL